MIYQLRHRSYDTPIRSYDRTTARRFNGVHTQFSDLLAINGLFDYLDLLPPTRQAFFAMHPDANEAESAFGAQLRTYQFWNALLYHLLGLHGSVRDAPAT